MFKELGMMLGEAQIENAKLKAENENWQKEYWKLEQGNGFLAEKNSKLKGCLTEIKEIAEICCKTTDCKKCKFFEICENNCVDVILQKISEVEE